IAARTVAALVAVAAAAVPVSAAGAARSGSDTIVVRLMTDPSPPGVDWSFSGIGPAFRLGTAGTAKTLSGLDDGTYRLVETGTAAQTRPTLFTLPMTPATTYLDVKGAEPNLHADRYAGIERAIEAARPRPTVYYHLAYQPAAGRVAVEYWFAYLYNDFYDKHE